MRRKPAVMAVLLVPGATPFNIEVRVTNGRRIKYKGS